MFKIDKVKIWHFKEKMNYCKDDSLYGKIQQDKNITKSLELKRDNSRFTDFELSQSH